MNPIEKQFKMFGEFQEELDKALHPDLESEERAELESNLGCGTNEMLNLKDFNNS